jgi:hypothetical protein
LSFQKVGSEVGETATVPRFVNYSFTASILNLINKCSRMCGSNGKRGLRAALLLSHGVDTAASSCHNASLLCDLLAFVLSSSVMFESGSKWRDHLGGGVPLIHFSPANLRNPRNGTVGSWSLCDLALNSTRIGTFRAGAIHFALFRGRLKSPMKSHVGSSPDRHSTKIVLHCSRASFVGVSPCLKDVTWTPYSLLLP